MDYTLNKIVAIPNWSFFDPDLCQVARKTVAELKIFVHYFKGDIDHERTVTAFSGDQDMVFKGMDRLCEVLLPKIDLKYQQGVHPRIGALDVAPFVLIEGSESELVSATQTWAESFSLRFRVPTHLYEKAAREGNEYRLPYLRGQMGELEKLPDFGSLEHEQWGTTIVGVRDFLLAANLNLASQDISAVKQVAKKLRYQRDSGNQALAGVRALGFRLISREITQLSLNFTIPDATTFDAAFEIAEALLAEQTIFVIETELIGVIRSKDVLGARHLTIEPSQVVN